MRGLLFVALLSLAYPAIADGESPETCSYGLPKDLHASSFHDHLRVCLKEFSDGVLVGLNRDFGLNYKTETASKGRVLYTYYLDAKAKDPVFSVKEYENNSGLYTYFRRGAGNDSSTFLSRRVFRDQNGHILKYYRNQASNESTFLSRKVFDNQNGRYTYWRRGHDDDSESFFTIREFSVQDEHYVYYRTSNHDESTFASLKYKLTPEGPYSEFRLGYGQFSQTFLRINKGNFRDADNMRISQEHARFLLETMLWEPLADRSFSQVKKLIDQALTDVEALPKK